MLKTVAITLTCICFLLVGWLANDFYRTIEAPNIENPSLFTADSQKNNKNNPLAPSDRLTDDKIRVYNDRIFLDLPDASWSVFTDTHSMDPILSPNANGLEVKPKNDEDIQVGDIVAYKSLYTTGIIVHRVINKQKDSQGIYYTIKGDNNLAADPGKIRFNQINGIVVAIVY